MLRNFLQIAFASPFDRSRPYHQSINNCFGSTFVQMVISHCIYVSDIFCYLKIKILIFYMYYRCLFSSIFYFYLLHFTHILKIHTDNKLHGILDQFKHHFQISYTTSC